MAGYNDIEGTTTVFGEPGQRGGRVVNYEGAAIHLNTGGGPSNINTNAGNVNLNVLGNINTPVLQARMVEANTHTTGKAAPPIISPEVVQQGMGQLSKAVTSYTDTMNAIKAKDAELALRQKLFSLYHGDEKTKGFSTKEGLAATEGFKEFGDVVNSEMENSLMSLNPAARLKAREAFIDLAEGYRSKGATHTQQEYRKIREGQKQAEREVIAKEFHAYPPDALGKQVVAEDGTVSYVAGDLKTRYFSTYEAHEYDQARKGWESEVVNAAERLYMDKRGSVDKDGFYKVGKGLEEAKVFRDVIGKLELSEDKLGDLDKRLFSWEDHEMRQSLESVRMAEAKQEKNLKRAQNTREANLFASLYDGKIALSPHEVWKMAASQQISESGASALVATMQREAKGDDTVTDLELYNSMKEELLSTADSNFISDGRNLMSEVVGAKSLNRTEKKELINFGTQLRKEASNERVSKAYKEIAAVVPSSRDFMGKKTDTSLIVEQMAQREYDNLSVPKANESPIDAHVRALKFVKETYGTSQVSLQYMPPMYGGMKPTSKQELNANILKLEADVKSGKVSQGIAQQYLERSKEYISLFDRQPQKPVSTQGL